MMYGVLCRKLRIRAQYLSIKTPLGHSVSVKSLLCFLLRSRVNSKKRQKNQLRMHTFLLALYWGGGAHC